MKYKVYIKDGKANFDREIPSEAILIGITDSFADAMKTATTINNVKLTKNNKDDKERIR